jgi:phage antirepressor YoqD-like protein
MNKDIIIYEFKGRQIKVATYKQIAEAFTTTESNLRDNFSRNKKRFAESTDYFTIVAKTGNGDQSPPTKITYFTESGVLKLMKSIGTDEAWAGYDILLDTYFQVKNKQLPPAIEEWNNLNDNEKIIAFFTKKDQVEKLEAKNKINQQLLEESKPKVEAYLSLMDNSGTYNLGETAKILNYKNLGRNNLIKLLNEKGVFYKVPCGSKQQNCVYQPYINKGVFKMTSIPLKIGEKEYLKYSIRVTALGLEYLDKKIGKLGYKKATATITSLMDLIPDAQELSNDELKLLRKARTAAEETIEIKVI